MILHRPAAGTVYTTPVFTIFVMVNNCQCLYNNITCDYIVASCSAWIAISWIYSIKITTIIITINYCYNRDQETRWCDLTKSRIVVVQRIRNDKKKKWRKRNENHTHTRFIMFNNEENRSMTDDISRWFLLLLLVWLLLLLFVYGNRLTEKRPWTVHGRAHCDEWHGLLLYGDYIYLPARRRRGKDLYTTQSRDLTQLQFLRLYLRARRAHYILLSYRAILPFFDR